MLLQKGKWNETKQQILKQYRRQERLLAYSIRQINVNALENSNIKSHSLFLDQ